MSKVIAKDFRQSKEVKLPISGITVIAYSALLISDLNSLADIKNKETLNTEILLKTIKSWDLYGDEKDTEPLPLTIENFGKLPAADALYLATEIEKFATSQKKS